MDSEDVKQGIQAAKSEDSVIKLLLFEIFFLAVFGALAGGSWYFFPLLFFGLFIILAIPILKKIFFIGCSLMWAIFFSNVVGLFVLESVDTNTLSWINYFLHLYSVPATQVIGFCVFIIAYLVHSSG